MDKPRRGLGSLIPTGEWQLPEEMENRTEVEINLIRTNPYQPRLSLNPEHLQDLVDSIRAHGVIQPLLVRRLEDGYELIAGERRLTAARAAGLTHVPVTFRNCGEQEMLELAIVENVQREDINPIDRAKAYQRLRDEFGLDQDSISATVGKSRVSVTNSLRLLNLPETVQSSVVEGTLSEGHARALLGLTISKEMELVTSQIQKRGLSVRATESLVKRITQRMSSPLPEPTQQDPNLVDLESRLSIQLGTKVRIMPGKTEKARGFISIEYYGLDDLNRISGEVLGE